MIDSRHVFTSGYGDVKRAVIAGEPVLWCHKCLRWVDQTDLDGECHPSEPCHACGREEAA